MNKKILVIIGILIICICGGIMIYMMNNKNVNNDNVPESGESRIETDNKVLVVYFSAQNHTEAVAQKISSYLEADIFELTPINPYTEEDLSWSNPESRVSKEHDDESLRSVELVETSINNWSNYDVILIGYPIWWGIAAWPVNSFIESNDFNGKTVIPFCTSASSGLGSSGELLKERANSGNWLEGIRFNSNPAEEDITSWIDELRESGTLK